MVDSEVVKKAIEDESLKEEEKLYLVAMVDKRGQESNDGKENALNENPDVAYGLLELVALKHEAPSNANDVVIRTTTDETCPIHFYTKVDLNITGVIAGIKLLHTDLMDTEKEELELGRGNMDTIVNQIISKAEMQSQTRKWESEEDSGQECIEWESGSEDKNTGGRSEQGKRVVAEVMILEGCVGTYKPD
ncbi:hypothetical protein BGX38DRAFT_1235851 [Terfezia claveryi]|nr:hypothetical protein BGX38DRAFT_1235851 [Terfezia claveryi]